MSCHCLHKPYMQRKLGTYVSMLLSIVFQQEGIPQERSVTWFCSPQMILQSLLISPNNFPDFFVNQEWGITVGTQCLPGTYTARVVLNTVYLYKLVKLLTRKIKGNNYGKSKVTVILNLYKNKLNINFLCISLHQLHPTSFSIIHNLIGVGWNMLQHKQLN